MWQAEADTVCFACNGSGPILVKPGECRSEYGMPSTVNKAGAQKVCRV